MTTRTWFNCLDRFEHGHNAAQPRREPRHRPAAGRHRAPTIIARFEATQSSAGVNDRDVADGSDCASTPADPAPALPRAAFCLQCVEGSGIRGDGTDCVSCGGTGTPRTDTRTVEDTTGRPGATPLGGTE